MSDRLSDVLPRTILGGGQERGFRSGTQNVPGIVGLGVAVAERLQDFHSAVSKLAGLRGRFEDRLLKEIPDTKVICSDSPRLPNTSNVMFRGADADTLLAQLDAEGVICSNGSACSSMKPSASPVLRAVGLSEREAFQCLRFSFSVLNTIEEVDRAIPLIVEAVGRVRAYK
jgi:cysteine desulfurase